MRAEEPQCQEKRPVIALLAERSSTHTASSAINPSVWNRSDLGEAYQLNVAPNDPGYSEKPRLLFQTIDPRGIQFHLPRSGIVMPVGPDRGRHVVVVQFADPRGEITREAERLRQARL